MILFNPSSLIAKPSLSRLLSTPLGQQPTPTSSRHDRLTHRQTNKTRKLLLRVLLVAATVGASAIAIGSYKAVRGIILDNLKRQALLEVSQESEKLDHWLSNRRTEVTLLANSPLVQTMDWAVMSTYLKNEVSRQTEFHQLALIQPSGAYANTSVGVANANLRDRPWFKAVMAGQTIISNPVISRTTGITQVSVVTPIFKPKTTQVQGALSQSIRVNHLMNLIGNLRYGPGSYAFALNQSGTPIVHPDPEQISTQEKPVPSLTQASNPELAAIAQQMVSKQANIRRIQLEGDWVYVAYVPLRETDWSIALVIPQANIESSLRPLNVLATLLGGLFVIALLGIWRQVYTYELMRTRAEQEALLNRLTSRIRESLDLQTIVQTTVTELANLLQLKRVFFGWHDAGTHTLELEANSLATEPLARSLTLQPVPWANLQDCLHHQYPVHLQTLGPQQATIDLEAGAYLALAIPGADARTGYLVAQHTKRLDQEDQELLQAVADQLAIAITQAHLYSTTQEQVSLLNETLTKLNQAQLQLVQNEKMSSLGQLVAGIAHEINNPANFIHGNLNYANEYAQDLVELITLYMSHYPTPHPAIQAKAHDMDVEFLLGDFTKLLESMQIGTERIQGIVRSLRVFSRLDEAEVKDVDIHEGIDSTLMILQSRLKARPNQPEIQVVKEYGQIPLVECYAGQLNQVFMNIISNAIDALEEAYSQNSTGDFIPTITIRTTAIATQHPVLTPYNGKAPLTTPSLHILIHIRDNGPGIPEDVKSRIFDPFFTTKAVGQGTGMGLAISYQVVTERHQGRLYCLSDMGKGTEFVIEIPVRQTVEQTGPDDSSQSASTI